MNNSLNYIEAIEAMHSGEVVKYIGTVNGNAFTDAGGEFCMFRGVVFQIVNGEHMRHGLVYDPDFRYELTNEQVDTSFWPHPLPKRLNIK